MKIFNRLNVILLFLLLTVVPIPVQATLYKIVNSDGSITYSDKPSGSQDSVQVNPPIQTASTKTATSISENAATELINQIRSIKTNELLMKRRAHTELNILRQRLMDEQKNLTDAKAELTRNIQSPRTVRAVIINPNGEAQQAHLPLYPGYHRRIRELEEKIERYQRNIVVLQQDLNRIGSTKRGKFSLSDHQRQ